MEVVWLEGREGLQVPLTCCAPGAGYGSLGRPEPALLATPVIPGSWVPGRHFLIFMSHNFPALST